MFIVYTDALKSINFLNFVYQIFLNLFWSQDIQNICWRYGSFAKSIAGTYSVALMNDNMPTIGNSVFSYFVMSTFNKNPSNSPFGLSKFHFTIDFCHDSRFFRLTCFKEFCYTWKSTGNITCFTDILTDLNNDISSNHFFTIFNHEDSFDR